MKQQETKFLVGVRGKELGKAVGALEVQLLYRVDPQLKLLQVSGVSPQARRKGQIMGIDSREMAPHGDVEAFVVQVGSVLDLCGYGGVACIFRGMGNPCLRETVKALEGLCKNRGIPLLLPETYGDVGDYGKILISTALSGGSFQGRFRQAVGEYGASRVVMDVEPMGMDFLLPAPHGTGKALRYEEIQTLLRTKRGESFFSQELCAKYFTYGNGAHSLHFVLYDDSGTMEEKIRLGKLWKLWGVAVSYGDYGGSGVS